MAVFFTKLFLKGVDPSSNEGRQKFGFMGAIIGVLSNFLLFLIKFFVGTLMKSLSVTADAFNNLSDTLSSFITIVGFKLGAKPADEDHPFGHGRIEYFSGLIVSLLVFAVGIKFLLSSIERIKNPEPLNIGTIPLILLILSIIVKIIMSKFNFSIGEKINSSALKAAALDAKGDVLISSTVVLGLIISKLFNLQIDGYVGLFVAVMIIKSSIGLITETINPLLGEKVDPELIENIEKELISYDEIYGVHDTVVHNYGPSTTMSSTHAEVRADISLVEIHDIIDRAEKEIGEKLGIHLVIHIDPIILSDMEAVSIIKDVKKLILENENVKSVHDMRIRTDEIDPTRKIFFAEIVIDNKIKSKDEENNIRHSIQEKISKEYPTMILELDVDRSSIMLK